MSIPEYHPELPSDCFLYYHFDILFWFRRKENYIFRLDYHLVLRVVPETQHELFKSSGSSQRGLETRLSDRETDLSNRVCIRKMERQWTEDASLFLSAWLALVFGISLYLVSKEASTLGFGTEKSLESFVASQLRLGL